MSKTLQEYLNNNLNELKENGLYNEIDVVEGANGPVINIDGKDLINLSSNNYLGLATDEDMKKVAKEAIDSHGVGAGAVRTINGTMDLRRELEEKLAKFKGTESVVALTSGFNANQGAFPAIRKKADAILSDELNHASIIDGCRLSGAKIIRVNDNDPDDSRKKAKEATESGKYNKVMYITDGVLSMDGDVVNLPEMIKVAKEFDLITYVDDAHGSGVMGKGAGTVKHFGLEKEVDMQMGTLSKAIGVVGGYVAGSKDLVDYLKVAARPFLFSTALTPADTAAITKAVEKLMASTELHDKLWENGDYLKQGLKDAGFDIGNSETPITPVIIGDEKKAQEFSRLLQEKGVYAKSIVFPTVPRGTGRVRNMPTAA